MTLMQRLKSKYDRIMTAYAYTVPEDSSFYALTETLQHQRGQFSTQQDNEMAERKSLTSDANGKDLTQKAWKDRIVDQTSTITQLKRTISELEAENKRQKLQLQCSKHKQDWEKQEDGTIIDCAEEREGELVLLEQEAFEQEAFDGEEQEYWNDM